MKPYVSAPLAATALTGLGAAAAATAEALPGPPGLLAVGAEVCLLAFVLWPHTILPVGIAGGTIASGAFPVFRVTLVVAVHAGILAIGCFALLLRRATPWCDDRAARTTADGLMAATAVFILLGAGLGLALGNPTHRVMVAAYEFAIIPAYFFLGTHTLSTARALLRAMVCFLATAMVLTVSEFTAPGRHGGLFSALVLPPLLMAVAHGRGWRRAGLVLMTAMVSADVVLAGYRSVWLATGIALLIMLVRCTGQVRRVVATAVAAGATLLPLIIAAAPALHARAAVVAKELGESAGYRLPEAEIGLHVFSEHPVIGAGMGQFTPDVYLPNFQVTTVGPLYHVFYVMILANAGLVGLVLILRPLLRAVRTGLASADGLAVAFAALTCGFVGASAFAGPSDGHWELGLLPALTLLASRSAASPGTPHNQRGGLP